MHCYNGHVCLIKIILLFNHTSTCFLNNCFLNLFTNLVYVYKFNVGFYKLFQFNKTIQYKTMYNYKK